MKPAEVDEHPWRLQLATVGFALFCRTTRLLISTPEGRQLFLETQRPEIGVNRVRKGKLVLPESPIVETISRAEIAGDVPPDYLGRLELEFSTYDPRWEGGENSMKASKLSEAQIGLLSIPREFSSERSADEFLDCLCCNSEIPAVFRRADAAQ